MLVEKGESKYLHLCSHSQVSQEIRKLVSISGEEEEWDHTFTEALV